jgi:hypothetical protein
MAKLTGKQATVAENNGGQAGVEGTPRRQPGVCLPDTIGWMGRMPQPRAAQSNSVSAASTPVKGRVGFAVAVAVAVHGLCLRRIMGVCL